ncbi:MAG: glycosyl hydrolase family 28-related protein [Bacillota bacterium]
MTSKQMPVVEQPSFPAHTVSISDFGAVGDGSRLNTEAMQQAIDACAAAGGGTVVIPAGLWLTGPLERRSRIRLHAEKGAVIAFSRDKALYPLLTGYWEPRRPSAVSCQPPISGSGLMDIAITGEASGVERTGYRSLRALPHVFASSLAELL